MTVSCWIFSVISRLTRLFSCLISSAWWMFWPSSSMFWRLNWRSISEFFPDSTIFCSIVRSSVTYKAWSTIRNLLRPSCKCKWLVRRSVCHNFRKGGKLHFHSPIGALPFIALRNICLGAGAVGCTFKVKGIIIIIMIIQKDF